MIYGWAIEYNTKQILVVPLFSKVDFSGSVPATDIILTLLSSVEKYKKT